MINSTRTGAVGALLDEYELTLANFHKVIQDISAAQLVTITDPDAEDVNCRPVQAILGHVVRAGNHYAVQIANHKGAKLPRPEVVLRKTANEYRQDLDKMFAFSAEVFRNIVDDDLIEHDTARKIHVSWGQTYDIEQLMEHAIVHILRHRRQIEQIKRNEFKYVV